MKNVVSKTKSRLVFYILIICILLITIEFLTHKMAIAKSNNESFNIVKIISESLNLIQEDPFNFDFTGNIREIFISYQKYSISLIAILVILLMTSSMKKGEFFGAEYGSASWATNSELKKFKKDKNGAILGQGLYLDVDNKEYNINQFIIGGSGSGKTFRKIKPDVLQANSNFIITDSKGEIYRDTADYLKNERGYKIKVLNLIDPKYSMGFNPFKYLRDEKDVLILVDTFINNTEGDKGKGGSSSSNEGFWIKAETALLQSLIFYVWKELPEYEQNFSTVLNLLLYASSDKSEDSAAKSLFILDSIFEDLAEKNEKHEAVKCYKVFKLSAGQTASSIMIGLAVRFSIFISTDIEELTRHDEIELDELADGTQKIAIYVMISDSHRTFDVISAMFFSQFFQYLLFKADFEKKGSLDVHCRVLMDEFINIGFIPYFDTYLSTIRGRNLSATIILQEITQLKTKYKDNWETIIGCCDTLIFLGSPANETREYFSKLIGKTTVQQNSKSVSFGSKGGRNESVSHVQRDLITPDELRVIDNEKQIVIIRSEKPIFVDKFKTEKYKKFYSAISRKSDYKKLRDDENNEKDEAIKEEAIEELNEIFGEGFDIFGELE